MVLHRVIVICLVVGCFACGKRGPSSARTEAGATSAEAGVPSVTAVEAGPGVSGTDAPTAAAEDAGSSAASPGFVACRPVWTLSADPELRPLGGALTGGIAGLLVAYRGAFRFVLIAGEYAEALAVALDDAGPAPPEGAAGDVPLVGGVASHGDRFLVATGRAAGGGLKLWVRAIVPSGRLLPVNAPGLPGADGSPTLELPALPSGGAPTVLLHSYPGHALLAVAGRLAALTPTGAPAEPGGLDFALEPASDAAGTAFWRVTEPGAGAVARYVGPLGTPALAVDDATGGLRRFPESTSGEPFRFSDGWVPAAGERVWFAPDHVLRRLPLDPASPGATQVVAYDPRGRILAQVELPAGGEPLAFSRDARSYLWTDPAGVIGLCATDAPDAPPREVDGRSALEHPTQGAGTCGRARESAPDR